MEYIDFNIVQTSKTLSSDKIIINKYDNKISRLFFNFDGTILGRLYFAMLNPITNKYCMKPILNSQVIITTEVSVYPGKWSAILVGVQDDYEIIDNNIDQSKVTFVSNPFNRIIVRDNFLSDSSIEPTVNPAIDEALESLRISQDRLENAAIKATESALLSSENAEKTAQDKAKIEEMVKSVEGIDAQVKLVETYKNDAFSSAQQASTTLSSVNKQSEQVANMKQSIDSTYGQVTNLATKVSEDANTVSGMKSSVETLKNETQNLCKLAEDAKAVAELASTQTSKDKTTIGEWKISIDEIKNQIVIDKAEMDKIKADVNTNKVLSENAATQTTEDKNAVHLDRIAVETVKQNVEKLGQAVQEATQSGVQMVNQSKQTAVSEITKTGNTHKTAVEAAGTIAVQNIGTSKTDALEALETAKTDCTSAINSEGAKQTQAITTEGQKHLTTIQQTAQQAVANVNKAGQTQTERVQGAGETAVENIQTAQNAATKAVETAKTEAVEAIQTEGTAQTGNVTKEGERQVQAVQQAAQEIMADREQIAQNKADIAEIKEEIDNLSSAIINSATGEAIVVEDSSDNRFKGLSLYGKSTQVTTTGAQLYSTMPTEGKLINGITFGVKDGGLSLKGTAEGAQRNDGYFFKKGIELSPGTYTISFSGKGNLSEIEVGISGDDKNMLLSSFALYNVPQKLTLSEAKTCYVVAQSRVGKSVDCTIYIMLNAGSSALPYEPYTGGKPSPSVEYPQEIANAGDKGNIGVDVFGGNLLNITNSENNTTKITVDGDLITVNSKMTSEHTYDNYMYNFSLNPGLYILEADELKGEFIEDSFKLELKADNVRVTSFSNNVHKSTFTLDKKANMKLYIYNGYKEAGKSYTIKGLRLTAVKELQWEPYKPVQTLTIPTPNGLPGIPVSTDGNYTDSNGQQWLCDEIDLKRGKYVQRVKTTTLTGGFVDNGGVSNGVYKSKLCLKGSHKSGVFNTISNMFFNKDSSSIEAITQGYEHIYLKLYVSRLKNGENSTIDDVNAFIKEHPFKVVYKLETPIETDLPPEVIEAYKKLHTNYPVTTVLNDAGAGMSMSYVADTKNYTDNKIAESVKNQIQNLTNLLSLMPMETQAAMIENDVNRILESEVTK